MKLLQPFYILTTAFLVIAISSLHYVKYSMQCQLLLLDRIKEEIVKENESIRLLEVELNYLIRPQNMKRIQTIRFKELNVIKPDQLIHFDGLITNDK